MISSEIKKQYRREYYKKNKDVILKKNNAWKLKNKEKFVKYNKEYWARPEVRARIRKYYKDNIVWIKERDKIHYYKNKERHRELAVAKIYGIQVEDYRNLIKAQNNLCAICGNPEKIVDSKTGVVRSLSVDHCHKTGKVRGLLCRNCNITLGNIGESIEVL